MKHFILSIGLIGFLLPITVTAQTFTDSNLPIVIITTDNNREIPDDYKIGENMKIIFLPNGARNYVTDQNTSGYLNYNGHIGIELRGSSSQTLPKKPYGFTTNTTVAPDNNVSLLGMPEENDWVLNSISFDASLIRNYLSYDLSRSIGNYAARGVYCEVIINGDYKGLYILMEKIKIDSKRVNITKMTNFDIAQPAVTGGYIIKADKTTGGDPVAWTMQSYNGSTNFLHESPKPAEITVQQKNYIYTLFSNFQKEMTAQNMSIVNGYPSMIDIPSFVDFILVNELASNADAYQFSTFFHKDRNGKLRAGPVWDFDLTYGNDLFFWGYDRSHHNVWQFDNGDNTGARFWRDLYNNPTFRCYLSRRWKELSATGGPLSYDSLSSRIDQIIAHISEAAVRENRRWGTISNHSSNISSLKSWLQMRINYLNTYLSSFQGCANPTLPPLVISKINYYPKATLSLTSNDLEFIEITNNGTLPANLTGVYFRELGLTYQFPANINLPPGDKLYLAGDTEAFTQFYGFSPFGQFTRSLSNESENLVLADAFGNVIDHVEYRDTVPWPIEANGTGYYLTLKDLSLDNSLAENWTYSTIQTVGISSNTKNKTLRIYPNPAREKITVESDEREIVCYEIYDIRGRKVLTANNLRLHAVNIDLESLTPGTYLVKIQYMDGSTDTEKITRMP
jgi:hypothetical protein